MTGRSGDVWCALGAACLGVAAGLAPGAEEGALKPVACGPADWPSSLVTYVLIRPEKAAPSGSGLSARAKVGSGKNAGLKIEAAADYSVPAATNADVLYFDFTGEGRFDSRHRIPIAGMPGLPPTDYFQGTFGPAFVPVSHGGRMFPLGIRGYCSSSQGRHRILLSLVAAVEGSCRFGGKPLPVRFVDTGANFRFNDHPKVAARAYRVPAADMVLIDTGDGTFRKSVVRAYYGQPVRVNGAWYHVTVSADGTKASARPAKVAVGRLSLPKGDWEMGLVHDGKVLLACGGAEPALVPAGSYQLLYYRQWSRPDAQGRRAYLLAGQQEHGDGAARTVTIIEGRTTRLAVGPPLSAKLSVNPAGPGAVELRLDRPSLRGGLTVSKLTRPGCWVFTRSVRPRLRIVDGKNRPVETVVLEHG